MSDSSGLLFTPKFLQLHMMQFSASDLDMLFLEAKKEKTRRLRADRAADRARREDQRKENAYQSYLALAKISSGLTIEEFKNDLRVANQNATFNCDFLGEGVDVNSTKFFAKKYLKKNAKNEFRFFYNNNSKNYRNNVFILVNCKYLFESDLVMNRGWGPNHNCHIHLWRPSFLRKIA